MFNGLSSAASAGSVVDELVSSSLSGVSVQDSGWTNFFIWLVLRIFVFPSSSSIRTHYRSSGGLCMLMAQNLVTVCCHASL